MSTSEGVKVEMTGVRRSGSDMELVENWDIMMPPAIAEAYAPISCVDRGKECVRYMAEHRLDASKVIVVCATGKHREVLRAESDVMDILVLGCIPRKVSFYENEKRSILIREYIMGESLGGAISRVGSFSEDEVRTLGEDLCVLISELYERNLSVNPESLSARNIIIGKDGRMRFVEPEGIEFCTDVSSNWKDVQVQIGNLMQYLLTENSEGGKVAVSTALSKVITKCRSKSFENVSKLCRAIEASEPSTQRKRKSAAGVVTAAAVLLAIALAIPLSRGLIRNPSASNPGQVDVIGNDAIPGSDPVIDKNHQDDEEPDEEQKDKKEDSSKTNE